MPSASNKVEKATPNDGDQPIRQVLNLLEKKVRNLEKRKGKLDNYKDDRNKGVTLNEDQKSAVAKYDEVLQMLEFAKEMQKTANQCHQDGLKVSKKMARREQLERQQQEIARVKELLLLQDLLNSMGSETVRTDFMNGQNGALLLSPEKLDRLDELYTLVSSSRDDIEDESTSYENKLTSASEHLVCLLDGKNKEVLGTTYKELKELLMSIHNSKYFDRSNQDAEEIEEEIPVVVEKTEDDVVPDQPETTNISDQSNEQTSESLDVPEPQQTNQFTAENQPQPTQQVSATSDQTSSKFNFLQESQIDLESPHMDPAVVVAHPMAPAGIPPTAAYGQNPAVDRAFHPSADPAVMQTSQPLRPANETREDFNPTQPIPSQTYTNQNFNPGLQQSFNMQHLHDQPVLHSSQDNQNSGPPPPIPMPNQQPKSQEQPTFAAAAHMGFNNTDSQVFDPSASEHELADNSENQGQDNITGGFSSHQNRSGFSNRGNRPPRGSGNRGTGGAYRGRGGYQNGRGGGGYQGSTRDNYYQSNTFNGQRENGNFRNSRGATRGAGGIRNSRGNRGGRGGYNREQQQL